MIIDIGPDLRGRTLVWSILLRRAVPTPVSVIATPSNKGEIHSVGYFEIESFRT
jgi:hypothetical protein